MAFKRAFDICFSLLGLILSSPLWLIFGLLILLEDGPPVFYLQERVGKDKRFFKNIKFRSMVKNAEEGIGPVQAGENDARATKIGRFLRRSAMDELPQLINILKGEMSFVGPRALRRFEIELRRLDASDKELVASLFLARSKVVPGLTGAAQVFAPRDIPRIEKFRYDLWYIKHQGVLLDLKLIFLSLLISFFGRWETRGRKLKGVPFGPVFKGEPWQGR